MRAYFFCVIFTQLFGNSNYYPYFCVKITHKIKDLKYYKEIFCSSELELYFMEENGSCSFSSKKRHFFTSFCTAHFDIQEITLTFTFQNGGTS